MKKFKIFLVVVLSAPFLFQSCQKDDVAPEDNFQTETEAETVVDDQEATTVKVTKAMLKKLSDFYMNTDNVKVVDFLLPDGTYKSMVQVEEDIMLSEEQIMALDMGNGLTDRNYSTNNLVSQGRNISIIGFTGGGGQGLTQKERNALQWAVDNYNALSGVSISFTLTFGTDYQDKDMVVYNNPDVNGSGGSAGFPSNGLPNKYIQIYNLNSFNTNVIEHVITHEIGHSVGFRHTDWQTRQSCGQNVSEGIGGIGANAIPGTSAGYNPDSVMVACFSSSEDGEFDDDDIIGLQYMY